MLQLAPTCFPCSYEVPIYPSTFPESPGCILQIRSLPIPTPCASYWFPSSRVNCYKRRFCDLSSPSPSPRLHGIYCSQTMPFKPFASVTGRNSYSLFDIRYVFIHLVPTCQAKTKVEVPCRATFRSGPLLGKYDLLSLSRDVATTLC